MWVLETIAGLALIILTLIDGFETILQPQRLPDYRIIVKPTRIGVLTRECRMLH